MICRIVDLKVWQLHHNSGAHVSPDSKCALVGTLFDDMQTNVGATPVTACIQKLATSLALIYVGEREKLDLPLPNLPLALAAALQDG